MADNPTTEPTPDPKTPAPVVPDSSPDKPSDTPTETPVTFTSQEEFNRVIKDRLDRDRRARDDKFLSELGVQNLEEAKAHLTKLKELEERDLSESEKLKKQLEDLQKKAAEREQALEAMRQERLADRRREHFLKAATEKGGKQVDDLFILVQAKLKDKFIASFDDEANPDDKKLATFVAEVSTTFPAYFGSAGAGSPSNAHGIVPTSKAEAERSAVKDVETKFGRF